MVREKSQESDLQTIKNMAIQILEYHGVIATPMDIPKRRISRICRKNVFSNQKLISKIQKTWSQSGRELMSMMNKNNYSLKNIKRMDEITYFSDNMESVTVTRKGSKEVFLKNTGNKKKIPTLSPLCSPF